jgi:hypothetical protein
MRMRMWNICTVYTPIGGRIVWYGCYMVQVAGGAGQPATPQRRPVKTAREAPLGRPRVFQRDEAVTPRGPPILPHTCILREDIRLSPDNSKKKEPLSHDGDPQAALP